MGPRLAARRPARRRSWAAPWSPTSGGEGGVFARLAFEFLGPVPVGELSVEAKTVRPGRRVSLREATLSDGAGRPVMLCRAWRISASPASLPDDLEPERPTLPGPERARRNPSSRWPPRSGTTGA